MGIFINTLPVRAKIDEDRPLGEWLAAFQSAQADPRQYEHTPLVQIQGWSDVPRDRPLFDTLLVFENYPTDKALAQQLSPGGGGSATRGDQVVRADELRPDLRRGRFERHHAQNLLRPGALRGRDHRPHAGPPAHAARSDAGRARTSGGGIAGADARRTGSGACGVGRRPCRRPRPACLEARRGAGGPRAGCACRGVGKPRCCGCPGIAQPQLPGAQLPVQPGGPPARGTGGGSRQDRRALHGPLARPARRAARRDEVGRGLYAARPRISRGANRLHAGRLGRGLGRRSRASSGCPARNHCRRTISPCPRHWRGVARRRVAGRRRTGRGRRGR